MGEANVVRKTNFFKGLKGEFRKIMWPNVPTLMKQSFTVIFVTAIVGLIVTLIDLLYGAGILLILGK